jgi:hypothetical protein
VSRNQARLSFQGTSYANFVNALRSPSTRQGYENSLRRYLEHHKLKSPDDLLIHADNPRYIESQIIDYIVSLRKDGIAYASMQFYVAPIFTFYQLNDVVLNRKKVSRYLGEYKRIVKDNAYTTEQIQQMLQNADIRMRMILLLLTSTGARIGALPSLVLGNLTRLPEYGIYRVLFYEDSSSEYYNFTTRECASTGIENYLLYRQRCGERISFNEELQKWEPEDTPLIRLQFDVNDVLQIRHSQPITLNAIRVIMGNHLVKSGIRKIEHPTANSLNRVRKSVPLTNGFRKFTISNFVRAGVKHDVRQMLVDHKGGYLDESYLRLTDEEILSEYMKAEPYLTIDDSLRLKQENQVLKIKADKIGDMFERIEVLEKQLREKLK